MTLRDVLTDAVLARSRWKRKQVGYPEIERKQAAWTDQYGRVFVGHSSISVATTGVKLVAYDEWPVTSGELGRAYLRLVFGAGTDRRARANARGFSWQAPLVCAPVRHRSLAYVDITSAYWQLLAPFGPDDLLLAGDVVPGHLSWLTTDEVEADRALRHSIVGSIFSNHLVWWSYGRIVSIDKASPWSNPTLRAHAMQVLHAACGQVARTTTLHAWMTDAAIVDDEDADTVQALLASTWGLSSKVKARGPGAVVNATTYVVGDKRSGNLVSGTHCLSDIVPRASSNLRRVPVRQLRTVRERMAS